MIIMNTNILAKIYGKIRLIKIYIVGCNTLHIHKFFYEKEEGYKSMREISIKLLMDYIKQWKIVNFENDFKEFNKLKQIKQFLKNLQKELPNMSSEYIEERIRYMYNNYLAEDIKKLKMICIRGNNLYLRKLPIT